MPANMGTQVNNGKAFEYACIISLFHKLRTSEEVILEDSAQYKTAKRFYEDMPLNKRLTLEQAALAAVRVIVRLEPQLQYSQADNPLYLSIQSDAQGIAGDVRDILCVRRKNGWQIGLSCKHNHHAVKHSRLSDTINFGEKWFGIPCSDKYFSTVIPIFTSLRKMRDDSKRLNCSLLWTDLTDKADNYYMPILQAFLDELRRLADENKEIPSLLINYLIGKFDFYKVITDDSHRTTRVEAINIAGTLNRQADQHRSIVDVPKLKLPSRFYHMDFLPGSDNTVEVVCDEGWTITMRLHNASSRVEPSLKFDVQLISLPSSIHAQVEPW